MTLREMLMPDAVHPTIAVTAWHPQYSHMSGTTLA